MSYKVIYDKTKVYKTKVINVLLENLKTKKILKRSGFFLEKGFLN